MFMIKKAQLVELLYQYLNEETPCKSNACVGYYNCEFCCNELYGESCAIQSVINGMTYYNSQNNQSNTQNS